MSFGTSSTYVTSIHNGILLNKKKEWAIDTCNNIDEFQKHCAK